MEVAPNPIQVTSKSLILCEGRDETEFLNAAMAAWEVDGIQCIDCGGAQQFARLLPAVVRLPGFEDVTSIGIIRDAETDARAALQSVQGSLRAQGLVVPKMPLESISGRPSVTIFITPGDGRVGMLEDLILEVLADQPWFGCVEAYFDCVEQCGPACANAPQKRRLQVALAACDKRSSSIGLAARQGLIDFAHGSLAPLREFTLKVASDR